MAESASGASNSKVTIAEEHWDAVFAPSSCLSIDTTVDTAGQVNAAAHATVTRVCHVPLFIAITVNDFSHTAQNVLATGEFVVNTVPFEPRVLAQVRVVGLPFAGGVNELERADLHELPAQTLRPPRVLECRSHFECVVEWTRHWSHRLMVCGRVVAVSMDADCYDSRGLVRWDRLKPAHYCGAPYGGNFVGAYEPLHVPNQYDGPRDWRADLPETTGRSGVNWSEAIGDLDYPNVLGGPETGPRQP